MVRIGDVLYGYCGGHFGRDSYEDKRVEALGSDWVVARDVRGEIHFASCVPEDLEEYKKTEEERENARASSFAIHQRGEDQQRHPKVS